MAKKTKIRIYKKDLSYYTTAATTVKASLLTGAPQANISKCLTGKLASAGGFIFVRVPENMNNQLIDNAIEEYFETRKMSITEFVNNKFGN